MKRAQIHSHTSESGSADVEALTDLEEFERQHQQKNSYNRNSQQFLNSQVSDAKNHTLENPLEVDEQANEGYANGYASDGRTATIDPDLEEDSVDEDIDDQPKQVNLKRRRLFLGIGVIILTISSVFGLRWWQFQSTHVSTDNAQIKGHLSSISANVPATVQDVLVDDGDYVEAGQTLIVLEDQDLNLQVQQAEADLAAAEAALRAARETVNVTSQTNPTQVQQAQSSVAAREATVSAAQSAVNQAIAQVKTSQANVAQAQTAVNQTQADFQRYQALYDEGAIPAQQLDAARAAYENAQAELTAANEAVTQSEAQVNNVQAQLGAARAEVEAARGQVAEQQVSGQQVAVQREQEQQAEAQVEQARAALELAQQQIAYTTIKAPVSGYVGQLAAQVGERVQEGQPLLSVVPLQADEVYIDANFKETALGRLEVGEEADVEVDAYPGETFHATVGGISPATGSSFALLPPDNATGNFNKVVQWVPIRLVFEPGTDPEHKLRPGLSVRVIVDTTTD